MSEELKEPMEQKEPTEQTEPMQPAEPKAEPENKPNPYESIIEQQNAQIAALIEQNRNLTAQFSQLIANGAQIGQQSPSAGQAASATALLNTRSLSANDDLSIESLAKEIGKHDRRRD